MGKRMGLALALAVAVAVASAIVIVAAGAAVMGPSDSAYFPPTMRPAMATPETASPAAARQTTSADPRPKTVTKGLDFFHARQKTDGGFGTMAATGWVILAAVASGERVGYPFWTIDGHNPFTYLQSNSHEKAATGPDVDNAPVYYARAIMAYVAAGRSERVFVAGTPAIDLLAKLYGYQDLVDGSPTKGGFSPPTFEAVHTTAWAILGMQSLGLRATDRFTLAEQWLVTQQAADGGFPAQSGDGSNCEDTAMAIQALELAPTGTVGPAVIPAARQFLKANQRADGGFPPAAGAATYASATSAVVQAILAMGERPDSPDWSVGANTPKTALASLQLPSGAYRNRRGDAAGTLAATAWALTALRDQPFTTFPKTRPPALKAFVFRPRIASASPANGARYTDTHTVLIRATYTDGSKGTGVNPQECRVYVDDVNKTKPADIGGTSLRLQLENVADGEHTYRLEIVDRAGNTTKLERHFTVATPTPTPTPTYTAPYTPPPYTPPPYTPPPTFVPSPEPTPSTTLTPSGSPSSETTGTASPSGYPVVGVAIGSSSPGAGEGGAAGGGGSGSAAGFLGGTLLALLLAGAAISYFVFGRRERAIGAAGEGSVLRGGGSAWERLKNALGRSKDLVKPVGR
jgi:hypothetical protein